MAKSIPVKANDSIIYHIELVHDFSMFPAFLQELGYGRSQKICIVTDSNVAPLYARDVQDLLEKEFNTVILHTFEAGEHNKNLETVNSLYQTLIEQHFDRQDLLVALGGGVVGNIAGYAAATFLRGLDYIQIPTTLLAQIDSSVGGKTAIDLPCGKNLVGAFKQPKCVICDSDVLSTLSDEIISDGMAEAIKYGMIRDAELFDLIATHTLDNVNEIIDEIVYKCISIKRNVVENDEFDTGERMILNFGHTLGHAIESYYNYQTYTHGSAVSIGMCMITERGCEKYITDKLISCVTAYKLPSCCDAPINELIKLCSNDKKCESYDINYILCKNIGHAEIKKVSISEFEKFILNKI